MPLLWATALAVPPCVPTTCFVVAPRWRDEGLAERLRDLVVLGVFALSGAMAYPLWTLGRTLGSAYYLVLLASQVFYVVIRHIRPLYRWISAEPGRFAAWHWLPGFTPFLLLASSLLLTLAQFLSPPLAATSDSMPSDLKTTEIVASVATIKELLHGVEREVSMESSRIDVLSAALVREINGMNRQLSATRLDMERVEGELEYYKALASLTEEQAAAATEAFAREARRNVWADRIIGFISGIFVTGAFSALQFFSPEIRERWVPPTRDDTPGDRS